MKQSPQEFFAAYKAARSAVDGEYWRLQLELVKAYCGPAELDQRRGNWERAQALEHISSVLDQGDRAEVLTETESKVAGTKRYLLFRDGERWRIERVQVRCDMCQGTGVSPVLESLYDDNRSRCRACSGSGWLAWGA
jgi:hypothetical protein